MKSIILVLIALFSIITLSQNSNYLEEHVILEDFDNGCSISAADFNNDGFQDFVATSFDGNYISWFENDGNQKFKQHRIISNFGQARVLDVALIDNDDDFDIVATAQSDEKISWFENDGEGNFIEHVIAENWIASGFVMARNHFENFDIDFDNDGDTDILATSIAPGNRVSWFENDGNQNFTEHIVKENWYWARYCTVSDVDQDNDLDIVGTAKSGEIIIFENDGSQNFTENIVIEDWGETSSVQAADIDKDGDIDLAGTSVTQREVAWFENDGNQNFTKHTIRTSFNGAFSVTINDIDNDKDLDILSIAWKGGLISVFENDGNQNFKEYLFCDHAYDMIKIFPTDLDSDGDQDVLGVCYSDNDLRWWENLLIHLHPKFGSNIQTGHIPLEVNFFDSTSSSSEITSWEWDFNNDGIIDSYQQNPIITFDSVGIFPVKLKVFSSTEVDSISISKYIHTFNGESSIRVMDREDLIETPYKNIINLKEEFTIETFIYPETLPRNPSVTTIFDKEKMKAYIPCDRFSLINNSIVFEFQKSDGSVVSVNTPKNSIELKKWQHIAISYKYPEKLEIHINGTLQNISNTGNQLFNAHIEDNEESNLLIGNNYSSDGPLLGEIDEFRIWSIFRNSEEINNSLNTKLKGTENGLILYYNMNEGNGIKLIDLTNNKTDANLINCEYWNGVNLTPITTVNSPNNYNSIPINYYLSQNYPNPFNPVTTINYSIPSIKKNENQNQLSPKRIDEEFVQLVVYDVLGREIEILENDLKQPGRYSVNFDASKLSSGVYYYQLKAEKFVETKKMILMQ